MEPPLKSATSRSVCSSSTILNGSHDLLLILDRTATSSKSENLETLASENSNRTFAPAGPSVALLSLFLLPEPRLITFLVINFSMSPNNVTIENYKAVNFKSITTRFKKTERVNSKYYATCYPGYWTDKIKGKSIIVVLYSLINNSSYRALEIWKILVINLWLFGLMSSS